MKGLEYLVTLLISLEIKLIFCAAPVWDTPRSGAATDSVLEDVPGGTKIYELFANDDDGETLTYSIVSQNPASPAFVIENTVDLHLPAAGVDAETATTFTLVFSVTDGTTPVTSVDFIVTVTDVDDNVPTLSPTSYTGSLTDGAAVGTSVFTLTASDDVTSSFTYAITGGNTPDTFEVDANGMVKVKDANNVDSTTTSSYTLTVTATESSSSTVLTATGVVTVSAAPASGSGSGGSGGSGGSATTTTTVATNTEPIPSDLSDGATAAIVVGGVVGGVGATGAIAAVGYMVIKKSSILKPSNPKIEPSDTVDVTLDLEKAETVDVNRN